VQEQPPSLITPRRSDHRNDGLTPRDQSTRRTKISGPARLLIDQTPSYRPGLENIAETPTLRLSVLTDRDYDEPITHDHHFLHHPQGRQPIRKAAAPPAPPPPPRRRGASRQAARTAGWRRSPRGRHPPPAPPAERWRACPDHRGLLRHRRPSAPDARPGVAAEVRSNIRIGSSTRQERPDCLRRPARVIGVHDRAL